MMPRFLRTDRCLSSGFPAALAVVLAATFVHARETADPGSWVSGQIDSLAQFYKQLHQTPELSFHEEQTAATIAAELRRLGLEVAEHVGGHGVVGVLANGEGRTLLLRADMDALPVAEETGLDYASQVRVTDARGAVVGVMHACGHDMHMTNLIGALRYLAAHQHAWRGTVVAIFQPAEERGAGAQAMLDDGLFSRFPRPDYAVALHVAADRPTGAVACRPGYAMANVDSVDIVIRGRGGHGAFPHTTIDPIVIAARLVLDLQTIVSREIKPIEPAVITVGAIHAGTKHNVIGDECRLQITVRSFTPEIRQQLIDAIARKARAQCASSGADDPAIDVSDGTPALKNDEELARRVLPAGAPGICGRDVAGGGPPHGGQAFGALGRAGVPIVMMSVGSVRPERLKQYEAEGGAPSLHSPRYYPDIEETIATGVAAFCAAALELLPPGQP